MESHEIKPIIEAMIFVSQEPLGENAILAALAETGVEKDEIRECLASIEKDWNEDAGRGIALAKVAGGYQFRTKQACADWLKKLAIPKPMRLSAPALETLAMVAYRQPIMRSEVEKIRGVDSGGVLKTLLERRLLRIVGRSQEPGQPLLYGTTKEFLEIFNLNNLKELPTLKDIDDLMRERREQIKGERKAESDDDEDLTEILTDEEEDETEIIRRKPLDEDEDEEKKDMESLSELEGQLKGIRKLEKVIFPKPKPKQEEGVEGASGNGEGDAAGEEGPQEGTAGELGAEAEDGGSEAADAAHEVAAEDAPAEDDRPRQ